MFDKFAANQMTKTAQKFQELAALRGISSSIIVKEDGNYYANDICCGSSVHGLYDWLNKQPGVRP